MNIYELIELFEENPCGDGGSTKGFQKGNTCQKGGKGSSSQSKGERGSLSAPKNTEHRAQLNKRFDVKEKKPPAKLTYAQKKKKLIEEANKEASEPAKKAATPEPPPEKKVATPEPPPEKKTSAPESPPEKKTTVPEPSPEKKDTPKSSEDKSEYERMKERARESLAIMSPEKVENIRKAVNLGSKLGVNIAWFGSDIIDDIVESALKEGRKPSISRSTVAFYAAKTKTIYLNEKSRFWNDPVASMKSMGESGWCSSSNPDHVVYHEIGHALHDSRTSSGFGDYAKKEFTPSESEFVKKNVSVYASTNHAEFVAEVYAAMSLGRKFSNDVMKMYRDFNGPPISAGSENFSKEIDNIIQLIGV